MIKYKLLLHTRKTRSHQSKQFPANATCNTQLLKAPVRTILTTIVSSCNCSATTDHLIYTLMLWWLWIWEACTHTWSCSIALTSNSKLITGQQALAAMNDCLDLVRTLIIPKHVRDFRLEYLSSSMRLPSRWSEHCLPVTALSFSLPQALP